MRILVTFAVEAEFAPWRKLRTLQSMTVGGMEMFQAQIGRATVDFVVTGMGMENARRGAEVAMAAPHTICIASGFAGSLKETHKVGDILAARAVQQLGKSKTIECSRNLFMAAYENQAHEARMFLTADKVIATAEEKKQLSPFADAVDMESFATLSVAKQKNLPAVAIRVVSDRFDQDMPVDLATTVDERGRVRIGGVVKHVASHPLQLPALIRLGRQSHTAAEALSHFLEAFIKELSFRSHGWPPPELQEVAAR
jgi:adenosylhomocysteine nucleosidase